MLGVTYCLGNLFNIPKNCPKQIIHLERDIGILYFFSRKN